MKFSRNIQIYRRDVSNVMSHNLMTRKRVRNGFTSTGIYTFINCLIRRSTDLENSHQKGKNDQIRQKNLPKIHSLHNNHHDLFDIYSIQFYQKWHKEKYYHPFGTQKYPYILRVTTRHKNIYPILFITFIITIIWYTVYLLPIHMCVHNKW